MMQSAQQQSPRSKCDLEEEKARKALKSGAKGCLLLQKVLTARIMRNFPWNMKLFLFLAWDWRLDLALHLYHLNSSLAKNIEHDVAAGGNQSAYYIHKREKHTGAYSRQI